MKAKTFDRIQVNALVRIVTAAAGMVEICVQYMGDASVFKKEPHIDVGLVERRQYSPANMIVSTRLTMGSPFGSLTFGSSYKSIFQQSYRTAEIRPDCMILEGRDVLLVAPDGKRTIGL